MAKSDAGSVHAPWAAGDCQACHLPAVRLAGESEEEAKLHMRLITPVNDHCVSCHQEMLQKRPHGHPPEQSYCASCHDPHASRQTKLLLDDDTSRACLDYPPPYRNRSAPKAKPAAGTSTP